MTRRMIVAVVVGAAGVAFAVPQVASASPGCEVMRVPAERAECLARERARAVARAEVRRRLAVDAPSAADHRPGGAVGGGLGSAAIVDDFVEPRLIAAGGGLLWFALLARARWRRRARAST